MAGSGAGGTVPGAEAVSSGAEAAGTGSNGGETAGTDGETERLLAAMTRAVIAPPARARQPAAASGLTQRRRSLARRRKSSHGSARGCTGIAAGGFGTPVSAALVVALGAAASTLIRSRRERSSSIVKIWSESDSSTTSPNEVSDLLVRDSAHFPQLDLGAPIAERRS